MVPTCTTWSTFHDENIPIGQGLYRRYHRYLESIRKAALTAPSDSEAGTADPVTPLPPRRPQINLEVLVSLVDPTWNPDLHQGLDYLWTIMNEFERRSFLEGITTERTSTAMSTVVPMPSKAAQPVTTPLQPRPTQEGQRQASESTAMDGQQREAGNVLASSSQTEQAEVTETQHGTATGDAEAQQNTEVEANETRQDTAAVVEHSNHIS